jgi:hypothetical protein
MEESKNIYQLDHTQRPALFTLIEAQNLKAVKQHIAENPAEINLKAWMDHTPLHIAVAGGNIEIVEYLIQHGADVNARSESTYSTPLCWSNNPDITKLLLAHGANMNDLDLSLATAQDKYEILDYLLGRGAQINPQAPEYLKCKSVEAIKVYLKHGIDISGSDKQNSNLLHKLAWLDLPEVFDFAYNNGVPWQKDSSHRTPYTLAKQGSSKQICDHLLLHYKTLTSHAVKKVDPQAFQFEIIRCLKQIPNDPLFFVALTNNANLVKYKIVGDRFVMDTIINIDVPIIRNFTFDQHGDIVVPTADFELLSIDYQSFALKKTIETEAGLDFDQITYLPRKQKFIASSQKCEIVLLDEDFTFIKRTKTDNGTIFPLVNEDESLISFLSYDQETFYCLFQLEDDLKVNITGSFYNEYENTSCGFDFLHQEFAVSYPRDLELYHFENGKYAKTWSLDISKFKSAYGQSALVFISADMILLGKGRTLLFVEKEKRKIVEKIDLDLQEEIRDIFFDKKGQHIIVTTKAEIRLFPLTIAQCYRKNAS